MTGRKLKTGREKTNTAKKMGVAAADVQPFVCTCPVRRSQYSPDHSRQKAPKASQGPCQKPRHPVARRIFLAAPPASRAGGRPERLLRPLGSASDAGLALAVAQAAGRCMEQSGSCPLWCRRQATSAVRPLGAGCKLLQEVVWRLVPGQRLAALAATPGNARLAPVATQAAAGSSRAAGAGPLQCPRR